MDYKNTYGGEIFSQSQCIWHETTLVDSLRSLLMLSGYETQDSGRFVWHKDQKRVLIAIVDDIEHLNQEFHEDFLSTLTDRDVVVTDNWIGRPLQARVLALPDSWFGIYAHRPTITIDPPTKAWSMSVNRIDYNRSMIMLELHMRGHITDNCLISFNCVHHSDGDASIDHQARWAEQWSNIEPYCQEKYQRSYERLAPLMPFRNHDLDFDSMTQSGLMQIVLETYISDHSVALSEKTFRALATPRLWRIFGGTWTVARLRQLGFDVMDDVIVHETDGLRMVEDKVTNFVYSCKKTWSENRWDDVESACRRAQQHNIGVLERWRQQWPADCARWYRELVDAI